MSTHRVQSCSAWPKPMLLSFTFPQLLFENHTNLQINICILLPCTLIKYNWYHFLLLKTSRMEEKVKIKRGMDLDMFTTLESVFSERVVHDLSNPRSASFWHLPFWSITSVPWTLCLHLKNPGSNPGLQVTVARLMATVREFFYSLESSFLAAISTSRSDIITPFICLSVAQFFFLVHVEKRV